MFFIINSSLYREVIVENPKLFVVAIDFGTTYSGYAFSAKSTPTNIYMCSWQNSTLLSSKAPTSVLLDKENKFVDFGYKAEAKYFEWLETMDYEETDSKDVFHYFNRFKMVLHQQVTLLVYGIFDNFYSNSTKDIIESDIKKKIYNKTKLQTQAQVKKTLK